MRIETLNAANEGLELSLKLIEVFMLIVVLLTIAGFGIYLAGIAWYWFEGKRQSKTAPLTARGASPHNTPRQARPLTAGTKGDDVARAIVKFCVSKAATQIDKEAQGNYVVIDITDLIKRRRPSCGQS
ncbi:MAG TPA: hypothetical protein VF131_09410 [Blastocatellia bacterium]|nr:hypothetical protein [Blastocatellia bacterium]